MSTTLPGHVLNIPNVFYFSIFRKLNTADITENFQCNFYISIKVKIKVITLGIIYVVC